MSRSSASLPLEVVEQVHLARIGGATRLPDPNLDSNRGGLDYWDRVATESVAILRSAAGRDPYNRALSDLAGELATQSEAFRTRWAAQNVRFHNTGVKQVNHPVVGELHLSYDRLDLAADPGLTIFPLHLRARLAL